MKLDKIFESVKLTENGDIAYSSTSDNLVDIVFMTEYYRNNVNELPELEKSVYNTVFAMMIRDPRLGFGAKNVGRELLKKQEANFNEQLFCGRADDLWKNYLEDEEMFQKAADFLKKEIDGGNELVKKWMPRYSSKDLLVARRFAKAWGLNKQQYGHYIKCDKTVENLMSRHRFDEIQFDHVPSLAAIKYANTFRTKDVFAERYAQFIEAVQNGEKHIKVAVSTPYDIYKNREELGDTVDTYFGELPKISGSWIPVVDTSGSMCGGTDAIGKALALGHYFAKCSSYAPGKVVSFSSHPQLITLGIKPEKNEYNERLTPLQTNSQYLREIDSMCTGDCSNTDFGATCKLLSQLGSSAPEYIIVLSDMEFDAGSSQSKDDMMRIFKQHGMSTKLIWWNLNSRAKTCPETDAYGNIFMSGYNPTLLKFLEAGFDGKSFVHKLVCEYWKQLPRG